jgi:hypothetical protein
VDDTITELIRLVGAETDRGRQHALLEVVVDIATVVVAGPAMSQAAAQEIYVRRDELGANPSKGGAVGQDTLLDRWQALPDSDLGECLTELDDTVDAVGDIANKFTRRNSGEANAGMYHRDEPFECVEDPSHRGEFAGAVCLLLRFIMLLCCPPVLTMLSRVRTQG